MDQLYVGVIVVAVIAIGTLTSYLLKKYKKTSDVLMSFQRAIDLSKQFLEDMNIEGKLLGRIKSYLDIADLVTDYISVSDGKPEEKAELALVAVKRVLSELHLTVSESELEQIKNVIELGLEYHAKQKSQ